MIRQNHIDPLPRVKAIRVFLDDRDNGWLLLHLMREYIGARDVGQGESIWAMYLHKAIVCAKSNDEEGLEAALVELVKIAEG